MANLKPAFDASGTVTAATASPLTDGASAVLVTSEAYADKHGLPKLARIRQEWQAPALQPYVALMLFLRRASRTVSPSATYALGFIATSQAGLRDQDITFMSGKGISCGGSR